MSVEGVVVVVLVVVFLLVMWVPERPISKCTRRDCGVYHVHGAEGRTYMTPEQREAMSEPLRRARQWHEERDDEMCDYEQELKSRIVREEYELAIFRWPDFTISVQR